MMPLTPLKKIRAHFITSDARAFDDEIQANAHQACIDITNIVWEQFANVRRGAAGSVPRPFSDLEFFRNWLLTDKTLHELMQYIIPVESYILHNAYLFAAAGCARAKES